jgi:glutamyl-Q tRNA(Asp) synthetase
MITTRFAPSPTGLLHAGHAHAALVAARFGDRLILRLEDIDRTRCRPEFADAILVDLAWLGIAWHGPVRVQSDHFPDFAASLRALENQGLLYPCFCSRAEIAASAGAPHDPDGAPVYPGTCRALDPARRRDAIDRGAPHAWRLDMASATARHPTLSYETQDGTITACPERFGDVVLARKDIPASYHLCATHDDALQGVTLVTRAIDLAAVTDMHRLLQALLGWPTPRYRFHRLITGPDGRRLSKRDGALSLRAMREAGVTPDDLRRTLGSA